MNIIIALLVFTVIIVLHELGHFLLAKKNGVGVIEFSIGMGPRLITLVKTDQGMTCKLLANSNYCENREDWQGKTKYSWKLLPIGCSCMMTGEDEVNEDPDSFQKAGIWGKISIIAAGPIFNFISAFIFALILIANIGYNPSEITFVKEGSPAEEAGLQVGDRITEIDGDSISIGKDFGVYFDLHVVGDDPLHIKYVTAKGEEKEVDVNPNYSYYRLGYNYQDTKEAGKGVAISVIEKGSPMDLAGVKKGDIITKFNDVTIKNTKDMEEYLKKYPLTENEVSITLQTDKETKNITLKPIYGTKKSLQIVMGKYEKGNVLQVIRYGASEIRFWVESTVKSLGMMIRGKVSKDDVSGVVGIVDMIGNTVDASKTVSTTLLNLLNIAILLSANLGVMNLIPFPALDGGRLVFLFIELFRGKPIDQEKEGMVHLVGIVLLMALMIFVTYNDIARIIGG